MDAVISFVDWYIKLCFIIGSSCVALIGAIWLYILVLLSANFALNRTLKTKKLFKVFLEVMYQTREESKLKK